MRIAFSVDDHFDVNHIDGFEMLKRQAQYLVEQGIDVYVNAGDTYNNFELTLSYFRRLQEELGDGVLVRFLAGNHDMVKGVTYNELESAIDPLYLHDKTLTLAQGDVAVIGNNGWYDYSLAQLGHQETDDAYAQWKRAFWIDSAIDQPISDQERMANVLAQTDRALTATNATHVIYATHFVPRRAAMVFALDRRPWQMATALMGSEHLGEHLVGRVEAVVFGHEHFRDAPQLEQGTVFYHQPLGYGLKRLFEWKTHDWFTEWTNTLVILDFPAPNKTSRESC